MADQIGLFTTRVVTDETYGFRILVKRFGLESRVGPRLQRGLPGSGAMFTGEYVGQDEKELTRTAKALEEYLNKFETSKKKKARKR